MDIRKFLEQHAPASRDVLHHALRHAFILFFIIGSLGIILIRSLRIGDDGTVTAIFASLYSMLLIFVLGFYYYKRRQIRNLMHGGDDLYYLGLLFTLVSLIYALVKLFIVEQGGDFATTELIGNFGIALTSTVAGIVGRVILHSFDDMPRVETDLNATQIPNEMIELRLKLREAIDAFSHFTRMTTSQAEQTAHYTENLFHKFNERMEESTLSKLEQAEDTWKEFTNKVRIQHERSVKALEKTQQVVESSVDKLLMVTEVAEKESSLAQNQIRKSVEQLDELGIKIESINQSLEKVVKNTEATDGYIKDLGESSKIATEGLDNKVSQLMESLEIFNDKLEAYKETISGVQIAWLEQISNEDTKRTEVVEAFVEKSLDQQQAVSSAMETLKESIEETNQLLDKLAKKAKFRIKWFRKW